MHKSRLCAFVIDCRSDDLDAAAQFWGAALGRRVLPADPNEPNYRELESPAGGPMLLVQKVTHESRIHLDVEANDNDAEVARLEALGAKRVGFVRRWWVMEAPTGQRFCVANPQRAGELDKLGNDWP